MQATPGSHQSTLLQEAEARWRKFVKEGQALAKSCTKPARREFVIMLKTVGWGCFVLGFFGAVIELLFIPIVRLLTGVSVDNRALHR